MELIITPDNTGWNIHVVVDLQEIGDETSRFQMRGDTFIPKAQCPTEDALRNTVQGGVSHMVHRMINAWRVSMMHRLRDTIVESIQASSGHGEVSRSAEGGVPATDIAEGVVPPCLHDVIYAPNDGSLFGRCVRCEDEKIPVADYRQSAMMAEGFLVRLKRLGGER